MARKDTVRSNIASSQSLSSTFISPPTIIRYLDNVSYQINVQTSNSMGTFKVQVSDDYDVNASTNVVSDPGSWVDLDLSGVPTVAGADDTILINLNQLPFNAIRLKYISTVAGTGTCSIWMVSKQVGG